MTNELPREPQEIKPHPHGVELGMLLEHAAGLDGASTVKQVLIADFSRVTPPVARAHLPGCAGVDPKADAATRHAATTSSGCTRRSAR